MHIDEEKDLISINVPKEIVIHLQELAEQILQFSA